MRGLIGQNVHYVDENFGRWGVSDLSMDMLILGSFLRRFIWDIDVSGQVQSGASRFGNSTKSVDTGKDLAPEAFMTDFQKETMGKIGISFLEKILKLVWRFIEAGEWWTLSLNDAGKIGD